MEEIKRKIAYPKHRYIDNNRKNESFIMFIIIITVIIIIIIIIINIQKLDQHSFEKEHLKD